jgi:membrane protein
MRTRVRKTVSGVRSFVDLVTDRNLTYMAAGIAYYAFVSILPLLLLAVTIASFVGGQALADRVVSLLGRQLSPSGRQTVTRMFTNTAGRGAASVVGTLTLAWSATNLFRGLDQVFDEVYLNESDTSLLEQVWNALVVGLGIALAVALVVGVGVVLSILPVRVPVVDLLGTVALVVVLVLVFLPIYYVLPPVDVSVREVLPGASIAAIGWVLLQVGFRMYAPTTGRYGAYGVIGAVLLFVTWLYFASIVVLSGAAVNAVRRT